MKNLLRKITGNHEASLALILVLMFVVVDILSGGTFHSGTNIADIFRNNALTLLMSLGMLLVLLTGGIDISITGVLAFSGMSIGLLMKHGTLDKIPLVPRVILMFLIATAIGTVCGLINGFIISKGKVSPIICTLGAMYIWRGMAYIISKNEWASATEVGKFGDFGRDGSVGPYIVLAVAFILFFVMMKWSGFGRKVYAIGSNKEAARISGINVDRVQIAVYTIMGSLAGLAGALSVSIYSSAQPNMQTGKEMDVIAACVIGGVSMSGGRGTVLGTLLGGIFYAIVYKALPLVGLESIWQNLIKGVIILVVVVINAVTQRTMKRRNLARREI
jgi:rhamnose transport system permease protein